MSIQRKRKRKRKAADGKGKAKGKGKDKGKGPSNIICWSCQKPGRRAVGCPNQKGISNVEEGGGETEAQEVGAGGVFWFNTVGAAVNHCSYPDLCGHCLEGWQVPRRKLKPNSSWIIHDSKVRRQSEPRIGLLLSWQ